MSEGLHQVEGALAEQLDGRDMEILRHLAAGMSGTRLANAVGRSASAVRQRVATLRRVAGVATNIQLVVTAIRDGVL